MDDSISGLSSHGSLSFGTNTGLERTEGLVLKDFDFWEAFLFDSLAM